MIVAAGFSTSIFVCPGKQFVGRRAGQIVDAVAYNFELISEKRIKCINFFLNFTKQTEDSLPFKCVLSLLLFIRHDSQMCVQ